MGRFPVALIRLRFGNTEPFSLWSRPVVSAQEPGEPLSSFYVAFPLVDRGYRNNVPTGFHPFPSEQIVSTETPAKALDAGRGSLQIPPSVSLSEVMSSRDHSRPQQVNRIRERWVSAVSFLCVSAIIHRKLTGLRQGNVVSMGNCSGRSRSLIRGKVLL